MIQNIHKVIEKKIPIHTTCADGLSTVTPRRSGFIQSFNESDPYNGVVIHWTSANNNQTTSVSTFGICQLHVLYTSTSDAVTSGCTTRITQPIVTWKHSGIHGWADTHVHMFAEYGFGGRALWGSALGPIEESMKACPGN